MLIDKVPPYSEEAERSVLGAMMLSQDAVNKVLPMLKKEDFYRQSHQDIYETIKAINEKGVPVDLVTVVDRLADVDKLEPMGGAAFVADFPDSVPTTSNVEHYAKIVSDKSLLRALITAASEIVVSAYEESQDIDHVMDEAERKIFAIAQKKIRGSFIQMEPIVKTALEKLNIRSETKGALTGLGSGYRDLDHITLGVQKSDLIILAARPAMGKTAFSLNIAQHIAVKQKKAVAVFSLEMPAEQLAMRMLASEAMISAQKIRSGDLDEEEWDRIVHHAGILAKAPIYIADTPGVNPLEMRSKCRRLQAENGLDLVIVDYLQLMDSSRKNDNRQQELSEISRSLKALARELDVPVMALSQLSRAVETRQDHRPQLSDLRESGALEQDADIVAFIYRDEVYNKENSEFPNMAELIIAKHRNGPVDKVMLTFMKEFTRFDNYVSEANSPS